MERYDVNDLGGMSHHSDGDYVLYADAQATVEALQRERDEDMERIGKLCEQVADLERKLRIEDAASRVALDAEREKVKGLEDKLDLFLSAEHIMTVSWKGKVADRDKQLTDLQAQLSQLQALVRALPVFTYISVQYTKDENDFEAWDVRVDHGPFAECETEAAAQGLMAILKYRATLDATTPAAKGGDGE